MGMRLHYRLSVTEGAQTFLLLSARLRHFQLLTLLHVLQWTRLMYKHTSTHHTHTIRTKHTTHATHTPHSPHSLVPGRYLTTTLCPTKTDVSTSSSRGTRDPSCKGRWKRGRKGGREEGRKGEREIMTQLCVYCCVHSGMLYITTMQHRMPLQATKLP